MAGKGGAVETAWILLKDLVRGREEAALRSYLVENSRLPGPRANLELAAAFAGLAARLRGKDRDWLWTVCESWTAPSAPMALPNDPREFLVFCGARGLGGIGSTSDAHVDRAVDRLLRLATDPRWRTREAVAMAIQDLLRTQRDRVLPVLASWIRPGAWFEMRAVAAGLAEPPLLKDARIAEAAVEAHRRILKEVHRAKDRSEESFKVLRQGLGYTVSVVVAARPKEGFDWLGELAQSEDADVAAILRENLKKARLTKAFPRDVKRIAARMRDQSP